MKLQALKAISICLAALAGYNSANASPTYLQSCFETEAEARIFQDKYKFRKIDNTDALDADKLAQKYAGKTDVELSELQSALGKAQVKPNEDTNLETREWTIMFIGGPSSSEIRYNDKRGYCLDTRLGGTRVITYTWTPEIYDGTRGKVTRYDFYI